MLVISGPMAMACVTWLVMSTSGQVVYGAQNQALELFAVAAGFPITVPASSPLSASTLTTSPILTKTGFARDTTKFCGALLK